MPPLTDKAASFAGTETQGETTVGDVPEMVARVARAMCEERIRSELRTTGDAERDDDIAMGVDYGWSEFASTARAALAAMRDPPDSMAVPGGLAIEEAMFAEQKLVFDGARDCFNAMIDAALGNTEGAR